MISFLSFIFISLAYGELTVSPLPKTPPIPKNNPQTKEKIELGKMLYHDPRVSVDGTISCNSCHNVMLKGGDDGRSFSSGVRGQRGGRSAGTVFNSAFYSVQFWDGRADSLEKQAEGPVTNPIEMGNANHKVVMDRLKKIPGYVSKFRKVFGTLGISLDTFTKAIASYERTLITPNAPFDKYLKGNKKAIGPLAIKGWATFKEIGCITCHNGAILAGPPLPEGNGYFMKFPTYPNTAFDKKYKFSKDLGRFEVTKKSADRNMFRVPTLRNIAYTAPYFHNGSVPSLPEAVRVMGKTQLNLDLNKTQVNEVVAFLESLTGEKPRQTMPDLPGSTGVTTVDPK